MLIRLLVFVYLFMCFGLQNSTAELNGNNTMLRGRLDGYLNITVIIN